MAVPFDPSDPSHLSPEQRLEALAAILATGVRRPAGDCPAQVAAPSSLRFFSGIGPRWTRSVGRSERPWPAWLTHPKSTKGDGD